MAIEEPKINVALTTNNGRTSILVRRTDADADTWKATRHQVLEIFSSGPAS
ncbi:MAG: hypothetical protein V4693_10690 [Pseudomonadota bacterium]